MTRDLLKSDPRHRKLEDYIVSGFRFSVNGVNLVPVLIIFGKIHILLISEKEFFHEIKRDGITSLHGIHEATKPQFKTGVNLELIEI